MSDWPPQGVKWYYSDKYTAIAHGDCRAILPVLAPVDLVLTDPPYGIGDRAKQTEKDRIGQRKGGSNTWHPDSWWDKSIDPKWGELVSQAAPIIAWFGHWRKREEVQAAVTLPLRSEIVWVKDCHTGPPSPVAPRDERIWLFSNDGITGNTFETSVWEHPIIPTWEYRHHKNEKPIGLINRLVCFLSKPDATILDPFLGSGTTAVAAKQLGRKCIGIEIEEKYCEIAANRLQNEPEPLFVLEQPAFEQNELFGKVK